MDTHKQKLSSIWNTKELAEVTRLLASAHQHTTEVTKCKQGEKFDRLCDKCNKVNKDEVSGNNINTDRWVINLSDRTIDNNERSVLRKGLNYAVTPTKLPIADIIAGTEAVGQHLPDTEAAELRSDVVRTVKRARLPKPNITKAERAAFRNLQKDDTIIILPADKGRSTVLMNTDDYKTKITVLVSDTNTYSKLKKDPTTRYKTKLVNIFKQWEKDKSISERLHWRLYPNAEEAPKLYGTPEIHKPNAPLRPIVSCCGSITYNAARYLATVLSLLVGNTIHSVKNSKELVDKLKGLVVPPGQKLMSYDVKALFTSVPVDQSLNVIECKLRQDLTLPDRSELNVDQLIQLLEYCLTTTYFVYGGEFYQQVHGAAMGSPVSPIVANLYMEHFESIALSTAPRPPSLWFRYVDDTYVLTHEDDVDSLTSHINNIDGHIQFTTEPVLALM